MSLADKYAHLLAPVGPLKSADDSDEGNTSAIVLILQAFANI